MSKLYLSLLLLAVSFTTAAQQITLSVKDQPLEKIFSQVQQQSGYIFWYNKGLLEGTKPVTLTVSNVSLQKALEELFKDQPLGFQIVDRTIVLSRKYVKMPASGTAIVGGTITDKNGHRLFGVTVALKGTGTGAISDEEGRYKMAIPDAKGVLVFSFTGFQSMEVSIAGRSQIDAVLTEKPRNLDETVVIGYGSTTERFNTGNVSTVRSETIAQQPVTNPLQALIGRVPGLQVTQTSGLPGAPVTIQIRGRNSILSSNEPLILVDGVPFSSVAGTYFATQLSPLNSISPEDIESVSVLKDADATAIYGSRAANGVILITTKKGKSGKTQVSASFAGGFSQPNHTVQLMSTAEYLEVRKDAFANSGVTPTATNAPDLLLWSPETDNKVMDYYMGNTARNTDASVSISGGSAQTTFLFNTNYHRETTVRSASDRFRRANFHLNLQHRSANDKFRVQLAAFYTASNSRQQFVGQALSAFLDLAPNYPVYNADGSYNWTRNNVIAASKAYRKDNISNLNSNLLLQYRVLPGLDLKISAGYNRMGIDNMNISPSATKNPLSASPLGSSVFIGTTNQSWVLEPQLAYNRRLGVGTLQMVAGATLQQTGSRQAILAVTNYSSDLLLENPGFGTPSQSSGINLDYRYLSAFGRATYNWEGKYIINGTLRRDGSTRFGEGQKFGNFGSIGGAWIFTEERFASNLFKWWSYGKVRASWGTTGNDGTTDYQYLSTYSSTLRYGDKVATVPTRVANTDYSWEVNKKLELALDLGFLEDRMLFGASWYRNRCGNQIVNYPLAATTGFSGYTANLPAVVENHGWEFELSTQNSKGKLAWNTDFNLTIPRNELIAYPGIENSAYANTYLVGNSLNIVQAYRFLGVDPQTGDGRYLDVDGNGVYLPRSSNYKQGGDYVAVGSTDRRWYAGVNNSLSFKGLQLDIFFQYTRQSGFNLLATSNAALKGGVIINGWTDFLHYWKQPGDQVPIPKPVYSTFIDERYERSDAGFADASFLRLKTVSLSYSLPGWLIRAAKLRSLKVYAQGQNLWTKTKYIGYDPEMAASKFPTVPTLRTIAFGIQCSL